MSKAEKQEIIAEITRLLNKLTDESVENEVKKPKMLTVKEATELTGLATGTIRQLCWQNKIPHIRAGVGKRGKFLINEDGLIKFMQG